MTPDQRRRYRVLTGYGLTPQQARESLGLVEVVEAPPQPVEEVVAVAAASEPEPVVVIIDEVPPLASPEIWANLPAVDERGRYRGICERVPDPMARYRHGG